MVAMAAAVIRRPASAWGWAAVHGNPGGTARADGTAFVRGHATTLGWLAWCGNSGSTARTDCPAVGRTGTKNAKRCKCCRKHANSFEVVVHVFLLILRAIRNGLSIRWGRPIAYTNLTRLATLSEFFCLPLRWRGRIVRESIRTRSRVLAFQSSRRHRLCAVLSPLCRRF